MVDLAIADVDAYRRFYERHSGRLFALCDGRIRYGIDVRAGRLIAPDTAGLDRRNSRSLSGWRAGEALAARAGRGCQLRLLLPRRVSGAVRYMVFGALEDLLRSMSGVRPSDVAEVGGAYDLGDARRPGVRLTSLRMRDGRRHSVDITVRLSGW